MKNSNKKILFMGAGALAAFAVWTLLLRTVDVMPTGPDGSSVGFATVNQWFHRLTGTNMWLYTVTDWLGLVPIGTAFCFALLGLFQWVKRKSLLKVDRDILLLGAFYIAVILMYILFEALVINYRPVLIDGILEASYPSSTTMLTMCVMPTSIMQLTARIKKKPLRLGISCFIALFTAFTVIGRIISGVHWITDIIGGALLSIGLVLIYGYFTFSANKK